MSGGFNVDSSKIARNTLYLYVRMCLVLGVNFYAVRLLLELLGVEDYGIYNVVFGFVLFFSVLNGALSSMMNRFLCHEIGKDDNKSVSAVFGIGFWFFLALTAVLAVVAETLGLWFFSTRLNIPAVRMDAARIVYQFAVLTTMFKTMQIPFISMATSFERMGFFAKVSTVEALSILASVLILKAIGGDRLVVFAGLYSASAGLVLAAYLVYVRLTFAECSFRFKLARRRIKEMGEFFSYSIFGAAANLIKEQGLDVLLNIFCGVAFNATWALSRKIGNAIAQITWNFQTAFYPQIIKSHSAGDMKAFHELTISTSRYSFVLIWLIALPILLDPGAFLGIWLKGEMPPRLPGFTQLVLGAFVLEALSAPLWMAAQADGKIKFYQISVSLLILSGCAVSYFALRRGAGAICVPAIVLAVNVFALAFRLFYLKMRYRFPLARYLFDTMAPAVSCAALSYWAALQLRRHLEVGGLAVCAVAALADAALLWMVALTSGERRKIVGFVSAGIKSRLRK